jgi:hypothetical protein
MDIMPTILDYAGYQDLIPESIDGSSLRPLIEGDTVEWRDHVIGMRDYPTPENPNTQYMMRTEKWKYWWSYREGLAPRLYDLETDPLEKNNLAGNPEYYERQMELHNALTDWVKDKQARQHEVMEYMEPMAGFESERISDPVLLYPNPAGGQFTLSFYLTDPGEVSIKILDVKGSLVSTDHLSRLTQGATVYSGSTADLCNGTYFVRIETDTYVAVRKLIVSNQLSCLKSYS